MKVISLGWGVQSFALVAMSALEVLPPVDVAIHSDTGWEHTETYKFAEKWIPWLEERGVQVVTIRPPDNRPMLPRANSIASMIPFFTRYPDGRESGKLWRECTSEWKIKPIRRYLQEIRNGQHIEQYLGITADEASRAKVSTVKYIINKFPFLEYFDKQWARTDVIQWLIENNLEVPLRSSCIICPLQSRAEWRRLQMNGGSDWAKAVAIDIEYRNTLSGYVCYLCNQRKPLEECDFRSQEEHGQLALWNERKGET